MAKTINKKIQELFEESKREGDSIQHFFDGLLITWREAEQKFRRMFATLLLFWALTFLIAKGLITEGSLAGLKVSQIQTLLIASPIIIGTVGYLSLSALGMATYLKAAVSEYYKFLEPKLQDEGLHLLLAPPTFLNIESSLRFEATHELLGKFHVLWIHILIFCFFLIPLLSLIHCSYLMWIFAGQHWSISIASIATGSLFLIAGVVSFVSASSAVE